MHRGPDLDIDAAEVPDVPAGEVHDRRTASRIAPPALRLILIAVDVAASALSLALGGLLANEFDAIPIDAVRVIAVVWFLGLPAAGLFQQRNSSRPRVEATRGVLVAAAALIALAVLGPTVGLVTLRAAVTVILALLLGWLAARALVRVLLGGMREAGHLQRPVVIATSSQYVADLEDLLLAPGQAGYHVRSAVPFDDGDDVDAWIDEVVAAVHDGQASGVVISPTGIDPANFHEIVHGLSPRGVHVEIQLPIRTLAENRIKVTRLGRGFSLYLKPPSHTLGQRVGKRLIDVVLSAAGLLALAPVLAWAAIAVKLDSKGPVFFVQQRVGRGGKPFGMIKFRSMVADAEDRRAEILEQNEAAGPLFKITNDPRITPIGAFLRRTSFDELPQLWNVLKGDMSLVGPRPALEDEMAQWSDELQERLDVAPGVTGMWQVYRSRTAYGDDYAALDLHYVRNWTLANDLGLILRTLPAMFAGRGET